LSQPRRSRRRRRCNPISRGKIPLPKTKERGLGRRWEDVFPLSLFWNRHGKTQTGEKRADDVAADCHRQRLTSFCHGVRSIGSSASENCSLSASARLRGYTTRAISGDERAEMRLESLPRRRRRSFIPLLPLSFFSSFPSKRGKVGRKKLSTFLSVWSHPSLHATIPLFFLAQAGVVVVVTGA
jgi:hypothetical protein